MNFVSLTSHPQASIVERYPSEPKYTPMAENELKTLEKKIDELIALCNDLNRENQSLKRESMSWQDERLRLVENNELARVKVEAMITRLQALEQES